jgi:1-acyl-sn-glycerol-3-phosphate acyltransferase
MFNHTTVWDQFLIGVSFPKFMYYVASEHLMRLGFASTLIKALADPIPRKKGADSAATVRRIIQELKRGVNVCIAVEGNCTFNGETGWISDTAGKLAKLSGADLAL